LQPVTVPASIRAAADWHGWYARDIDGCNPAMRNRARDQHGKCELGFRVIGGISSEAPPQTDEWYE
jgi:hypothetical protein